MFLEARVLFRQIEHLADSLALFLTAVLSLRIFDYIFVLKYITSATERVRDIQNLQKADVYTFCVEGLSSNKISEF